MFFLVRLAGGYLCLCVRVCELLCVMACGDSSVDLREKPFCFVIGDEGDYDWRLRLAFCNAVQS